MRKGSHHSLEARKKMSEAHKGKPRSVETRKKMSESMKGRKPWNIGIPHSEEHRRNISLAKLRRKHMVDAK